MNDSQWLERPFWIWSRRSRAQGVGVALFAEKYCYVTFLVGFLLSYFSSPFPFPVLQCLLCFGGFPCAISTGNVQKPQKTSYDSKTGWAPN